MSVFQVWAVNEHGRRWLSGVVEASNAKDAVARHLVGQPQGPIPGRRYEARRV